MASAILKVQKNKNVTLPAWLMKRFHLEAGDYIRIEEGKDGVYLKPAKLIDPSQSYFWTREWQTGEADAENDIRKGKVKSFKKVKDLIRDLEK